MATQYLIWSTLGSGILILHIIDRFLHPYHCACGRIFFFGPRFAKHVASEVHKYGGNHG